MAKRPLTFGIRYREKGRTVQVKAQPRNRRRYVLEVQQPGQKTQRREHASLAGALRGFAAAWRERLH